MTPIETCFDDVETHEVHPTGANGISAVKSQLSAEVMAAQQALDQDVQIQQKWLARLVSAT
ncbi:MAG: hypothetical protein NVSMB28_23890 [Collimonas sp.]